MFYFGSKRGISFLFFFEKFLEFFLYSLIWLNSSTFHSKSSLLLIRLELVYRKTDLFIWIINHLFLRTCMNIFFEIKWMLNGCIFHQKKNFYKFNFDLTPFSSKVYPSKSTVFFNLFLIQSICWWNSKQFVLFFNLGCLWSYWFLRSFDISNLNEKIF